MTYAEQIPDLPEPQRAAARELLAHPESPEAISHALTVGVPTRIVSFASSRPVHDAEHIAHDLERHERELAARIAEAA